MLQIKTIEAWRSRMGGQFLHPHQGKYNSLLPHKEEVELAPPTPGRSITNSSHTREMYN